MACRASAGSDPPRSSIHLASAQAAAPRASPVAPRRHAQRGRQLARRRDQAQPLRRPVNLAVRAGRNMRGDKIAN